MPTTPSTSNAGREPVEFTVDKLVYGGDGIGRLQDGRAVFVPFVAPGERVRARLTESKKGFARAELLEVLEPSEGRVPPRCRHFAACGGCHYQHLPYEMQLAAKEEIVRDQLARIGGLTDPPVEPAIAAPNPWNYRNHIQFDIAPDGRLGFHRPRSDSVLAVQECHLPEPAIDALWPALELDPEAGLIRVAWRTGAGDDRMLLLETTDHQPPEILVESSVSAVHIGPDGPAVLAGAGYLEVEVLERLFRVSAESFFQTHTAMSALMVAHVKSAAGPLAGRTVLDLYCGVGLFSAFLAGDAGNLIGVEKSPAACLDYAENLDEFDNVELYQGAAEDVLPGLKMQAEVIVADPPRSGLSPAVVDGILALEPETLIYVSCDPATLARDARRLARGGLLPVSFTPFDLFPQTYHIECVSVWKNR